MVKIIQTDCETPEELLAYALALTDSEQDQVEGWFDATLNAFFWFGVAGVAPLEAAQLLSQFNPQTAPGDWFKHTTDRTTPTEHQNLLRGFEDIGGERPLLDWMAEATARGWRYHPWADEYVEAVGVDNLRDRIREAPPMPETKVLEQPERPVSKAALIKRNLHHWPTVAGDVHQASGNGLAYDAKAGARGWIESKALAWAGRKNKLSSADKSAIDAHNAFSGIGRFVNKMG